MRQEIGDFMKRTKAESLQQKEDKHAAEQARRLAEALIRHKLLCDFLTKNESMTLKDYDRLVRQAAATAKKSLPSLFKAGKKG
jgi:predicted HTH transcriptional regulator